MIPSCTIGGGGNWPIAIYEVHVASISDRILEE